MKELKIFFLFVIFLATGLCPLHKVSADICNRVVAIVNDDIITLYELDRKIREMTGVSSYELRARDERAYIQTRRNVLDLLINEKISQEKIRELGIEVSENEVDSTIEKIKMNNGLTHEGLLAGLKEQGISYESYRENIKDQLERVRLINFEVKSRIIVTEEKIREYYDQNREQFSTKEKVHLATIILTNEGRANQESAENLRGRAEEIYLRLRQGEDFGELARKFSQGPGAQEGGDIGFLAASELDPELASVVKNMTVGEVSDPITRGGGSALQVIKLLERREGTVRPFEEVKDSISDILYRAEVDKRYSAWIKELRKKAYTKIIF